MTDPQSTPAHLYNGAPVPESSGLDLTKGAAPTPPVEAPWQAPSPVSGPPAMASMSDETRHDLVPAGRPPAQGTGSAATGQSHVPETTATADHDDTTVISETPLVWPELAGTPIYRYPDVDQPAAYAPPPLAHIEAPPVALGWGPPAPQLRQVGSRSTETITCPQCGTVVQVDSHARSSLDFCPNPTCDFPLFWVKTALTPDNSSYGDDSSHRRLPGTVGRASAAFLPCPHCLEPNQLSAVVCVRCGMDMHPIAAPPPPAEPVYAAPVFVAEQPKDSINWWLIVLVGLAITLFVAFVVVISLSYLGN
jgi:hypothetical protein